MADVYGSGGFLYKYVDGWDKLPEGWSFRDCPSVGVDSHDNVYVITRGEHPIIVFDREGNFLRSFGDGLFSQWTHGLYVAYDDTIWCSDIRLHTIQKFSPQGEKLMELGEKNQPTPKWSGQPFNQPTSAAVMPSNGDIYVSDGYGNSRIHVYTPSGEYKFSWGSPGIDPGQFLHPHNIAIDGNNRVYVVDRTPHRIQVFDAKGKFLTMWNNIFLPDAMALWQDHIYIGELMPPRGLDDAPGVGHRVSIYDLDGNMVCRFGAPNEGEGPGEFIAPHGIAVDSSGDIYVGEVSYTIRGSKENPPREPRCLSKYARQW